MKGKRFLAVFASVLFVAIAFAAGRLSRGAPRRQIIPQVSIQEPLTPPRPETSADSPPPNLRDVSLRPFDQTYKILKTASPPLLQRYVDDLRKISPRPTRWAALREFFKTLIQANPTAARELVLQLEKRDGWNAIWAMKNVAPPQGMKEIVEVLLTYKSEKISDLDVVRDTVDDWGKNDPLALKEFIESHPGGKMDYYDVLLRNWAAYDPQSALDWINRLLRGEISTFDVGGNKVDWSDGREGLMSFWMEGLIHNDRRAAIDYLLFHGNEPDMESSISIATTELFLDSPQEARDFINRLPKERQAAALKGVAWKADRLVWGDADDATRSPEFVAGWMTQFPPEAWAESIAHVLSVWRQKDTPGLFDWMAGLPTESRQVAAREFRFFTSSNSVRENVDAALSAHDLSLREQLLEQLMAESSASRSEMAAALEHTQLTPEQRARLVSLISDDQPTAEVVEINKSFRSVLH